MKTLVAIAALAWLAAPLQAQGLVERQEEIEARLALLEKQIIASPAPCRTLGEDWKVYKNAEGRFLMGDDGDADLSESGGQIDVTLDTENLPSHRHDVTNLHRASDEAPAAGGFLPGAAFGDAGLGGRVWVKGPPRSEARIQTEFVGSARPVPILPRFVEVHFCTKSE